MFFRRSSRHLRSDPKLVWRGYPRKRKRVRVNAHETTTSENFMSNAARREKYSSRTAWFLIFAGSTAVLIALCYVVFFSDYFRVHNIIIVNTSAVSMVTDDEVKKYLYDTQQRNIFLVNIDDVITSVIKRSVRIKFIQAERVLPDTIRITIEEYPIVAHLWQGRTNDNVLVNEAGFVVSLIPNPEDFGDYVTIKTFDSRMWREDGRAIPQKDLHDIITAVKTFENQFGIEVSRADYLEPNREMHLVTVHGWQVWFDFSRTVPETIADLILVFNEARIAENSFSRIDVRIPGKAFICRERSLCSPLPASNE